MRRSSWFLVAGLAAGLIVAGRVLPIAAWTIGLVDLVRASGPRGVALLFAASAVGAVLMLPGSPLAMVAGFAYGPIWGLLVAWPASVVAGACAFLLGRTVLRTRARRIVAASPRAQAFDRAVGRSGFTLVVLLRMSPVTPFNLVNYALSLSSLRFERYLLASALGEIPGAWFYVYLGSTVATAAELATASAPPSAWRIALQVAGLAATAILVVVTARIARRALDAS
jgi:uncharacterized membrane protein YdjX (TVP38/TMEM64 family)